MNNLKVQQYTKCMGAKSQPRDPLTFWAFCQTNIFCVLIKEEVQHEKRTSNLLCQSICHI